MSFHKVHVISNLRPIRLICFSIGYVPHGFREQYQEKAGQKISFYLKRIYQGRPKTRPYLVVVLQLKLAPYRWQLTGKIR